MRSMLCAAMLALATAAASAQQKDPYANIYVDQKRAAYELSMGRFLAGVEAISFARHCGCGLR